MGGYKQLNTVKKNAFIDVTELICKINMKELNMSDVINIIIGVFVGIFTNLLAWWILFHGLSPSLRFSPSINKNSRNPTPGNKTKYIYRIRLENIGCRNIIDLEIMARLRLKGMESYPKDLSQIVYIPLGSNGETVHKIPYILPAKKNGSKPILILHVEIQEEFKNPNNYPKNIVNKAKIKTLLLEDVLRLGKNSYLQVIGFGYDEFSGSRKIFKSRKYTLKDVQYGGFAQNEKDVRLNDEMPNCKEI
jgi:hypothetical protein